MCHINPPFLAEHFPVPHVCTDMKKKLLMPFLVAALAIAGAKTYDVTFDRSVKVAGAELKAGEYRVNLAGDKVVISNGKQSVESAVKVEQNDARYRTTAVRISTADDRIKEIHLGGTNTKLVFNN